MKKAKTKKSTYHHDDLRSELVREALLFFKTLPAQDLMSAMFDEIKIAGKPTYTATMTFYGKAYVRFTTERMLKGLQ